MTTWAGKRSAQKAVLDAEKSTMESPPYIYLLCDEVTAVRGGGQSDGSVTQTGAGVDTRFVAGDTVTLYYEHAGIRIFHGDCREVMPSLAEVDVTITDPPYSEHVHKSNRKGLTAHAGVFSERRELGFEFLDPDVRVAVSQWLAAHTKRWIGVFSDTESSHLWSEDLVAAGSEYIRTAFWHKVGGAPQFTGDRPAVACEAITLCHQKGRKQWNGGGRQGIYSVPIVVKRGGPNEVRVHTTQKPIDLMLQLVADFSNEGEVIFDPFMGSGTTLVAAKQIGRRAIGCELDEASCESAVIRLSQEALVFAEKGV